MSFSVLTKSLIEHPLQGRNPIRRPLLPKHKTLVPTSYEDKPKEFFLRKQNTMIPQEISFQYEPSNPFSVEAHESSAISEPQPRTNENVIKTYPSPSIFYNPNQVPPNFTEANNHREAHRVNPFETSSPDDEICPSTGLPLPQEKLKIDCHRLELSHLGPVLPMYLLLVNQIGLIAALLLFTAFVLNVSQYHSIFFEYREFMTAIFQNKDLLLIIIISIVSLILALFWILHLFRRKQKLTKIACKKTRITPSNYTVMCSNMGRIHTNAEVTKFFSEKIVSDYSLNVAEVVITYSIEKYTEEIRKLQKLIQEKEQILEGKDGKDSLEDINMKIEEINMFFEEHKRKLKGFEGLKKNGVAFITFFTKQEAKTVRRKFEMSAIGRFLTHIAQALSDDFAEYFFKHHLIKVEKAPELNEIIWDDLNCNDTRRLFGLKSILAVLILSSLTYCGVYLIMAFNIPYSNLLSGLTIVILNETLAFMISWLGLQERFKTITEFNIALIKRVTLAQLCNMILPVLVVNIFILDIPLPQFSESLGIMSLVILFIPLIYRCVNPSYLQKVFYRKQLIDQGPNCQLSQAEANQIFEDPEINVPRLYASCLGIILFSCFYFPLSPILGLIGFLAIVLHYWIEKFNILRRSLLPTNMRSEIAEAAFEFLDLSPLFLAIGSLVMISADWINEDLIGVLPDALFTVSLIVTVLAIIYVMLPNKKLNRAWLARKNRSSLNWVDELFYQQARDHMPKDYLSINPVFRDKNVPTGIQDFYVKAREKFQDIAITKELPEILPLFDYTMHRPTLYEISKEKKTGLNNPFYSFPQNYGYGLPSLALRTYEAPKSVSYAAFEPQKAFNKTWKGSYMSQRRLNQNDKENKQPVSDTSMFKSAGKRQDILFSPTEKISVFGDWSLLLRQNTKNEEEGCKGFEFTPRAIGAKNIEQSPNRLDQPDFLPDFASTPLKEMSPIKAQNKKSSFSRPLFSQKQNDL